MELITNMFNKYLNGETIPEDWKRFLISSIKREIDNRKNYRNISVFNSIVRLYGRSEVII